MPDDLKKLLDQMPDLEADPRAVDALIVQLGAAMPPLAEEPQEDQDWRPFLGMCGGVAAGMSLGFAASALGLLSQIPTWVYLGGGALGLAILCLLFTVVARAREGEI